MNSILINEMNLTWNLAEYADHIHDVTALDKVALVLLSVILIGVGVFPSVMVPMVESGVEHILEILKLAGGV